MILIDDFAIDVATTEEHQLDAEVTEYPVEDGAAKSDHVRLRPIGLSLDCIVSNTPIGTVVDRRGDGAPADDCYAKLIAIRDAREPVTVTTSLKTYENMLLETLGIPQTSRTGDALEFRVTFRQMDIVTNRRTTIRVKIPRAKRKVDRGHKPTTPATPSDDMIAQCQALNLAVN